MAYSAASAKVGGDEYYFNSEVFTRNLQSGLKNPIESLVNLGNVENGMDYFLNIAKYFVLIYLIILIIAIIKGSAKTVSKENVEKEEDVINNR